MMCSNLVFLIPIMKVIYDEGGADIRINRSRVFVLNMFSEFVRYMSLAEGVHLAWSLDFNF